MGAVYNMGPRARWGRKKALQPARPVQGVGPGRDRLIAARVVGPCVAVVGDTVAIAVVVAAVRYAIAVLVAAAVLVAVGDAVAVTVAAMLEAVRHAVVIAVTAVAGGPAGLLEEPAALTLHPAGLGVDVAGTFGDPDSRGPLVAVAAPFPITGLPDEPFAKARRTFEAGWRRGHPHFVVADLGDGVPATRLQAVAAAVADPFAAAVLVAVAGRFPMAGQPHVALAVPVPVAGRPHVAAAGCGHAFKAGRGRRRVDDQADAGLGHRGQRQPGGGADGEQGGNGKSAFHVLSPVV